LHEAIHTRLGHRRDVAGADRPADGATLRLDELAQRRVDAVAVDVAAGVEQVGVLLVEPLRPVDTGANRRNILLQQIIERAKANRGQR
jgi:hypothetical protein